MVERLSLVQSEQLLAAYRATFTSDNHGDAVKSMYLEFELRFGMPRKTLQAAVLADRQVNAKVYRKLLNELARRAQTRGSASSPPTSKQTPEKRSDKDRPSGPPRQQPIRCPRCDKKLAHQDVEHYGNKPGRRCGDAKRKPATMAETLAKWNIELEQEYVRPVGQRIHELVINIDTGKWQATGVLGALGYHVGANGVDQRTRRAILAEAVEVKLTPASPRLAEYVEGWGAPNSRQRVAKIRDSIRAFAQIRRSAKADYAGALADWESDLVWLKAKYNV